MYKIVVDLHVIYVMYVYSSVPHVQYRIINMYIRIKIMYRVPVYSTQVLFFKK